MLKLILLALFSMMILSSKAHAADAQELSVYLDQELSLLESGGLQQLPATVPLEDEFFFRRFWFRIRPKAIFSLPRLVKIQVVPEVELLWERALPDGWTGYKR
jgi:hypothetical protein